MVYQLIYTATGALAPQSRRPLYNGISKQEGDAPQNAHPDGDGSQHVLGSPRNDGCDDARE